MKKLVILISFLILINLASAIQVEMKSSFSQSETLIAKISGNFITPPTEDNIIFKREHVRIGTSAQLVKIKDDYYIYAQLPEEKNNYTMTLQNIGYRQGTKTLDDDIIVNFSTTSTLADFSINKGFITTDKDFYVELLNLQPNKIYVSVDVNPTGLTSEAPAPGFFASLFGGGDPANTNNDTIISGEQVAINSGDYKRIYFSIPDADESFLQFVKFSSSKTTYNVPIYVIANDSKTDSGRKFRFEFPANLRNISLSTNSLTKRNFYIYNDGEIDLENITLSLSDSISDYANLSTTHIEDLKVGLSERIELNVDSDAQGKTVYGALTAIASPQDTYAFPVQESLALTLNFIQGYVTPPDEDGTITDPAEEYCIEELNGKICASDEECSEEEVLSAEGGCCLGTCNKKDSGDTGGSYGPMIGWGLLVIMILIGAWFFFKKYRGAKGPSSFLDKVKAR